MGDRLDLSACIFKDIWEFTPMIGQTRTLCSCQLIKQGGLFLLDLFYHPFTIRYGSYCSVLVFWTEIGHAPIRGEERLAVVKTIEDYYVDGSVGGIEPPSWGYESPSRQQLGSCFC
jgi:hypothetical protein